MRGKFKKFVVYLLATAIVTPLWLVSGLLNAKPAMAAVSNEFDKNDVYVHTLDKTTGWDERGQELFTWGSKPSAYITANALEAGVDPAGFYLIEAQWNIWDNHTQNAKYQIIQGLDTDLIGSVDQQSLADGSSAPNDTLSGYYTLAGNYHFNGDNDVDVKLLGESDDNGNVSFISFKITLIAEDPAPVLSAEDFGVVNYDVGGGLGTLKGYTAGFGLTDATFENVQSVVVKLYSGDTEDTLLQTNTAILAKFNADITGTQFSSPFDVSGTFDYITDGYWTNVREAEYGQSIPATKVVATVTLANGKIVTATNESLTGDPTTIYPLVLPAPSNLVAIDGDGEVSLTWNAVVGADHYNIYYQKFSDSVYVGPISTTFTSAIITGLQNDVKYRFIVRAADVNNVESANAWLESTPVASRVVLASAPITITPEIAQAVPSAVEQPAEQPTTPAEEGQIKGEESTTTEETSEKINWTPWIILFILIVLAGAATGGYFYWFAGDEETQEAVKPKTEATKKPVAGAKTKAPDKKPRRW